MRNMHYHHEYMLWLVLIVLINQISGIVLILLFSLSVSLLLSD